jgi:1-acyl-sn-glycerol-3-phosphate acyltransferase
MNLLAGLIRIVTGVQDRWVGVDPLEADGRLVQRIYFANHASHLDAPVIWASLPPQVRARTRPVAASDYWGHDRLRRFVSQDLLRVVMVDRGSGGAPGSALAPLERALLAGDSLILFPEGTRNPQPDDGLLDFKSGLYHLARQFPQVELVPTWLANLNRILPKGEVAPVPLLARVTFGAPVLLRPGEDKGPFLERARLALLALSAREEL